VKNSYSTSVLTGATSFGHVLQRVLLDVPIAGSVLEAAKAYKHSVRSLQAVMCVAAAIETFAPLGAEACELRLAILGAEEIDAGAGGVLYELLGSLLGRPDLYINLEIVGPGLKVQKRKRSRNKTTVVRAVTRSDNCEVSFHRMNCGEWWRQRPKDEPIPDVLMLFHPGFEANARLWFAPSELPVMLSLGKPVVIFAYDQDEADRDSWLLQMHGSRISTPQICMIGDQLSENIAECSVSSFAASFFVAQGFEANTLDNEAIELVSLHSQSIADVFTNEGRIERHSDAFRQCYVYRPGGLTRVYHVFGSYFYDESSNEVFVAVNGRELTNSPHTNGGNALKAHANSSTSLSRALYASQTYRLLFRQNG
jgi:hypothetical protein